MKQGDNRIDAMHPWERIVHSPGDIEKALRELYRLDEITEADLASGLECCIVLYRLIRRMLTDSIRREVDAAEERRGEE